MDRLRLDTDSICMRIHFRAWYQQPANILDPWSEVMWSEVMLTQIAPMLAFRGGNAAIDLYKAAFGAQLLRHLGGGDVVASGQLSRWADPDRACL
jgi:hypothetical protein